MAPNIRAVDVGYCDSVIMVDIMHTSEEFFGLGMGGDDR